MPFFGTFYRLESPTQTPEVAVLQVASGEVWGRTPRGGLGPTVQAYAGQRPNDRRGVEFDTAIEPHPTGSPFQAYWSLGRTNAVQERIDQQGEQFACITADVRNHQMTNVAND
jgi:hypothetical protein